MAATNTGAGAINYGSYACRIERLPAVTSMLPKSVPRAWRERQTPPQGHARQTSYHPLPWNQLTYASNQGG